MKDCCIKNVHAKQILDCKGRPAIEVDVLTEGGIIGRGGAPTGTSVGMHEAFVLRDNDVDCFEGLSVFKAIGIINDVIGPSLAGMDVLNQRAIDDKMIELDGTESKRRFGGNGIYSVSIACAKAAALTKNLPLYRYLNKGGIKEIPWPTYNMINGGAYNKFSLAFQEYTVVPYKCESIMEGVEAGVRIFHKLGDLITQYQGERVFPGNYWSWAPPCDDPFVNFELLNEAVFQCGLENKVGYAMDCAASEMYDSKRGTYQVQGKEADRDEIIGIVKTLTEKYPILYVEDILEENDWEGFIKASKEISKTIIIGDDFTVTNPKRLKEAAERHAAAGFIFKPNQIGTISECLDAHELAKAHNMITVPSIRAGGLVDDVVVDLAIAIGAAAFKNGAPRTGERVYAINALLRAEDENPQAKPFDFTPFIKF